MHPDISVILPVYNGGNYLSKSIESILKQTLRNFEFIIIDDGSTDDSLSTIKYYESIDDRIIVISRENKGLTFSLNEGITRSKSEYIARMDQDDISLPLRLELQLGLLIQEKLDICGGNYSVIDKDGRVLNSYILPHKFDEILLTLSSNVPFPHPSVMMRKGFLQESELMYGDADYLVAEDLDLWLKMFNKGARFGNVAHPVLLYRYLSTSISRVNRKKMLIESENQFNQFVSENNIAFVTAFEIISLSKMSNSMQVVMVKAAIRFWIVNNELTFLLRCIKLVRGKNFMHAVGSFLKTQIFIKFL